MDSTIEKRFQDVSRSKIFENIVRIFELDTKSVLDIGCSFGEFVARFGKGSTGISINETEVAYGTKRGLDIRYGNIESEDFVLNEKYDAIFANNLLEHLYSPHAFLTKIKQYLKPDGIVLLGVPCIPKIVSLLHIKKFRGSMSLEHINFFTKDTLTETVRRAGWSVSTTRGFRFKSGAVDHLFDPAYPHFYVVATIDPTFKYSEKRMKELAGYEGFKK